MLFRSIVFMNKTFRGQWISFVLVFVLKLDIASNTQIPNDNVPHFDSNFGSFLRDLGSMVYKLRRTDVNHNEIRSSHSTHSTPTVKNYRRNQITFNTQRAILEDVLMMKLVSYYEDKYKLSHLEPTTTESITIENIYTKPRLNNSYKYNVIDKAEVLNTEPKATKQVHSDLNRRMQRDMKKMDEYQVPEVVIF